MPDKKKTPITKMTERRGSSTEAPKTSKTAEPARTVMAARSGAGAVAQPIDSQKQLGSFEAGMKLFHARKLKEARDLFLQAAQGPERDVAHRSRLHASMCEQRLQQNAPSLRSAEDFYNYGVALLNTRQIDDARNHLQKALQMTPDADHVLYALAVTQALAGDASGAHDHLKRAIELEPKNRLLARQDGDFSSLSGQAPFQALLYPEKKSW
jgi:tetratricopeptide (TPR) repeat protein